MGSLSAPAAPPGGLAGLARGTLVYGIGSVLNRLVTFLLLPVLTRWLPPAEYGISALLDVFAMLLVALFSFGVGSSMTVTYFERRDAGHRLATVSTAAVLLALGAAALLAAAALAPEWLGRIALGESDRGGLTALALVTAAAMILQQPFSMRLQFEGRAARLVTLNVVATVLLMLFSLAGVVLLDRGVRGLWEGRLVAHALTLVLFAAHFPWCRLAMFRAPLAGDLLRLGLPMIPSFAAVFVLLQGNRYLLSRFAELDTVGVYSVGVQLGLAMGLAVSAFSTAWTPYFMEFRDRRDEACRMISRVMTWYVLGFGALSLLFYAGARPALMILTDPRYHAGFVVAGLAASAQWFIGVFNVLMPPCTFAREIYGSSAVQVLAALLAVALNLLLIPPLGMQGAGLALALGTAAMAALLAAWNRLRARRYLQVRYDAARLLPFAAFYVAYAIVLTRERAWPLATEIMVTALAAIVALAVPWWLLRPDERTALLARWRDRSRRDAESFGGEGGDG